MQKKRQNYYKKIGFLENDVYYTPTLTAVIIFIILLFFKSSRNCFVVKKVEICFIVQFTSDYKNSSGFENNNLCLKKTIKFGLFQNFDLQYWRRSIG